MPRLKYWKRARAGGLLLVSLKKYLADRQTDLCGEVSSSEFAEKSPLTKQIIVEVDLTCIQKKMIKDILSETLIDIALSDGFFLPSFKDLRMCCQHPYLLSGDEELKEGKKLVQCCGKMILLDKLLSRLKKEGRKVVLFCDVVAVVDILEDYLIQKLYNYEKFVITAECLLHLQEAFKRFDKPDADGCVFLLCKSSLTRMPIIDISTINLTAADSVIMYDWNGNTDIEQKLQACCHRPGQTREVTIYRLMNSWELEEFNDFLNRPLASNKKTVRRILTKAANAVITNENFCEEDLDETLQKRSWVLRGEGAALPDEVSKSRGRIDMQDPNFWQNWAIKAGLDMNCLNDSIIGPPHPKKKHEYVIARTPHLPFEKSKCLHVEKSLLLLGWRRCSEIQRNSCLRNKTSFSEAEMIANGILLTALQNFQGSKEITNYLSCLWSLVSTDRNPSTDPQTACQNCRLKIAGHVLDPEKMFEDDYKKELRTRSFKLITRIYDHLYCKKGEEVEKQLPNGVHTRKDLEEDFSRKQNDKDQLPFPKPEDFRIQLKQMITAYQGVSQVIGGDQDGNDPAQCQGISSVSEELKLRWMKENEALLDVKVELEDCDLQGAKTEDGISYEKLSNGDLEQTKDWKRVEDDDISVHSYNSDAQSPQKQSGGRLDEILRDLQREEHDNDSGDDGGDCHSDCDDNEDLHGRVHEGEACHENGGDKREDGLAENASAEIQTSMPVGRSPEVVSYESFLSSVLKQCGADSCHGNTGEERVEREPDRKKHCVRSEDDTIAAAEIPDIDLIKMAQSSKVKVSLCRLTFNKDTNVFDTSPCSYSYRVMNLQSVKRGRPPVPDHNHLKKNLQCDKVVTKKGRPQIQDSLKRKRMKLRSMRKKIPGRSHLPDHLKKEKNVQSESKKRGRPSIPDHLKKNRNVQSERKKRGRPSIPDHLKKNRNMQLERKKRGRPQIPDHLKRKNRERTKSKRKKSKTDSHVLHQLPKIEIEWDRAEEADDNYAELEEMDTVDTAVYYDHDSVDQPEDSTEGRDSSAVGDGEHTGNISVTPEAQEVMPADLHVTSVTKTLTERFYLNGREVDLDRMLNNCSDYTPDGDTTSSNQHNLTTQITPSPFGIHEQELFAAETPLSVMNYTETLPLQTDSIRISDVRTSDCFAYATPINGENEPVPNVISPRRYFSAAVSEKGAQTEHVQISSRVNSASTVKSLPTEATTAHAGDFANNPIFVDCDDDEAPDTHLHDRVTTSDIGAVVVTPVSHLASSISACERTSTSHTPVSSSFCSTAGTVSTPLNIDSVVTLTPGHDASSDDCDITFTNHILPGSALASTKERTGDIHFHLMDPATRAISTITLPRACTKVVLVDRGQHSRSKIQKEKTEDIKFSARQGEILADFISKNLRRISMSGPSIFFLEMHDANWLNLVTLVNSVDSAFVHSVTNVLAKVKKLVRLLDHQLQNKIQTEEKSLQLQSAKTGLDKNGDGPSEAIKPICKVQLEEEHDRIISNIQALTRRHANDTDNNTTHTLNWKDRRTREASNWYSVRSALQTALVARHAVSLEEVCHHCQSPDVTVRCVDCHYMYLCSTCDQEHHSTDVFHHRQFLIKEEERFLSVPPCTELEETDVKGTFSPIHKEKYLANILKHQSECSTCGDDDLQLNTWGSCIVVTLKGRFDLYLPQWTCKTCHCIKRPSVDDIIRIGYWPGNSKVTPGMYIFEEDVLFTFDLLKKEKPGLSIRAWLSMLEYSSLVKNRVGKISHKVFSEALREWQRLQFCLSNLKGENYMECPACYKGMHACHCDGNRKVYRFQGHNQSTDVNFYKDLFIADDKRVDEFVHTVKGTHVNVASDQCGQSHWQAAKTSSKSMKHLAETGLVVACCRHNVLLKAVNMFQGEIFAYPLFIQQELALRNEIEFFCQDVICKYWPWFSRIQQKLDQTSFAEAITKAGDMKPFLSVMHAKSHDWTCQILWGGKWQEGAAKTTGEEMEQCNSYLSTTGATTKNMSKGSREEQLTNHALHWNRRKIQNLPQMLMRWLVKAKELCKSHAHDLDIMKLEEIPSKIVADGDIGLWEQEVRKAATDDAHGHVEEKGEVENLFLIHHANNVASQLQPYAAETSEALSIITDMKAFRKSAIDHVEGNKPDHLHKLQERLTASTQRPIQELLIEGKYAAAARKVGQLQRNIEMLHTSVNIRQHNIQRHGDSGKHRHRLRRKMVEEKKKLDRLITDYNKTLPLMKEPPQPITDLMRSCGEWPWTTGTDDSIPFHIKRKFVEKKNEVMRNHEEVKLLEKEIVSTIECYEHYLNVTNDLLKETDLSLQSDGDDMETFRRGYRALLFERKCQIKTELANMGRIFDVELQFCDNYEEEEEDMDMDDADDDDEEEDDDDYDHVEDFNR